MRALSILMTLRVASSYSDGIQRPAPSPFYGRVCRPGFFSHAFVMRAVAVGHLVKKNLMRELRVDG